MAESGCDAAVVAETIEGSVDGISHQTQVSPHVIVDVAAVNENEREVVDLVPEWMNSIKEKARSEPHKIKASFSSCYIYRIPTSLRHFDEKTYVPQIISIGPLHYDKRRDVLQAMEAHKWRYLHAILGRNGEDCLLQCLRKVKQLEKQARNCYSEEIDGLDSKSFVEMLVLDACFIIELFCRFSEKITLAIGDDPIFNMALFPTLLKDLIMLENQIPFFILQELCNLMDISDSSLRDMARALFRFSTSLKSMFTESSTKYYNLQCHHLLHFLHLNCLLSLEIEDPPSKYPGPIPCASELQEAGIKFKEGDARFLQIKYRKGSIEIPPLQISPITEPVLLNLVSFEQCCAKIKPCITSYISFMDELVNSARDVKILSQKGIIIEMLGSSEDVAALFNKIGRDVSMNCNKNYLNSVSTRIKKSTKSVWPKFRATLMRDYFNNPWAFISFLAAVVLLVFTFFQTFFSAFPRFQLQK